MDTNKEHWENVYAGKGDQEVSWFQEYPELSVRYPELSVRLIDKCCGDKSAAIMDCGGGNSRLAEELAKAGFTDISVMDISANGLERARARMGAAGDKVNWIVSDVLDYEPDRQYDIWHDRAVFHFITDDMGVKRYKQLLSKAIRPGGKLILATFSATGPKKCSGLDVRQYDCLQLEEILHPAFRKLECFEEEHQTPFDTRQNFIWSVFEKA